MISPHSFTAVALASQPALGNAGKSEDGRVPTPTGFLADATTLVHPSWFLSCKHHTALAPGDQYYRKFSLTVDALWLVKPPHTP